MAFLPIKNEEPVFRPPSEGKSHLIQVTIGCSHNKCTYCAMYKSKKYRVRTLNEIKKDVFRSKIYFDKIGMMPQRLFLCDGDALAAPEEYRFISNLLPCEAFVIAAMLSYGLELHPGSTPQVVPGLYNRSSGRWFVMNVEQPPIP